jgi:hypothetical protein
MMPVAKAQGAMGFDLLLCSGCYCSGVPAKDWTTIRNSSSTSLNRSINIEACQSKAIAKQDIKYAPWQVAQSGIFKQKNPPPLFGGGGELNQMSEKTDSGSKLDATTQLAGETKCSASPKEGKRTGDSCHWCHNSTIR